jgi:uncharacterized protein YjbI with pentapeptide repeats
MSQLAWCYEVLELRGSSSWSSIQENYEDLLVVWNPERFTEHPRIQAQVLRQHQVILEAYAYLQRHYQTTGAVSHTPFGVKSKPASQTPSSPPPPDLNCRDDNLAALHELKPEKCYVHTSIDLRWRDFRGQVLSGVNWCGATLIGAKLEDANLEGANLSQANLWQARLLRVNLNEALLMGANLREAQLQRANLKGTCLEGAMLKRANLEGADLSNAELLDASFANANLRGAFFGQVDLHAVSFKGADLSGAIVNGRQLPEGSIY